MKKARRPALILLVVAVCAISIATAESFNNPVRITTNSDPAGIFVVDLNNDGLPDILWGGTGTTSAPPVLHTLLAQPSGGYLPGPTMTMPANVGSVCVAADETGDGIVDLVCPSAVQFTASIYTFPGKGDGSFGTPIITQIPSLPNNGGYVHPVFYPLTDLNGDGIPDLILLNAATGFGYVMLGNGHGGFTESASINGSYGSGEPQVIDLNGDGKLDILFPYGYFFLGKGDGTFTPSASNLPIYNTCIFHDMDGDGKPDAVCGMPEQSNGDIIGGTQLLIYHGNGDGTFNLTPITTVTYGDHTNQYNGDGTFQYPVAVLDINGDGTPDILAEAGDGLTVILGHPGLQFDSPVHYATGYMASAGSIGINPTYAMQIADLNNDGFPDIASSGPNGVYISYNQKDGTFGAAPAYEVTQVIGYQTVADFNEDGIPDVAATGDTSIELSLGKGDGTFQPRVALPDAGINFGASSATYAHILHGDFNGDHHQDIIAIGLSAAYQNNTYLLFGDGTGSFSSPQLVSDFFTSTASLSQIVSDLNRDGRDDLFSNDYSHLYAALSSGDGSFTTTTTTVSPNSSQNQTGVYSAAVLADFNNDGKQDAIWVAGPNVTISYGNGDGSFNPNAVSIPIPTSVSSSWVQAAVTAGDFDGDGNQDFAVLLDLQLPSYVTPGTVGSVVFVFYGDGHGNFTSGVMAGEFNRAYTGVFAADLNNEGLADLILKTTGNYAVGIVDSLPKRTFGPEINYYAGTGLADVSIADLNRDGFLDLLFSNGDFNIRASSVTVLMNQGNPPVTGTLTISPEPSAYGQPISISAAFVPSSFTAATGTVTFALDATTLGSSTIADNKATLSLSTAISPGTHTLTASWPGNAIYSAVNLSAPLQVEPIPSSVALVSSLNPAPLGASITFTASILSSSAAQALDSSGTVTFFDGQTPLGAPVSASLAQPATFTTSSLAIGTHSISAVYSGNSQFQGSTSSVLTETIPYFIGDFSIQSTPTAATVVAGQSATFQLTITPSGGFSAPLAFSCAGLPAQASCAFSPSTLSSGQGQVTLNVQTAGSTQSATLGQSSDLPAGGVAAFLAGFAFCLLPSRRRRLMSLLILLIACSATLLATSCGGGSSHGGTGGGSTPSGNYNVSVTAQTSEPSQNISHSVAVTLNVQ